MTARSAALVSAIAAAGCRQILGIDDVGSRATDARSDDAAAIDAAVVDAMDPLVPWGAPVSIAEVSSSDDDSDPSLTGDLLELYFSSPRPGGLGGRDVWSASRPSTSDAWGPPQNVAALSSIFEESNAEISLDGLVVFITSGRGGSGLDTYLSTRASRGDPWTAPVPVPALDSPSTDYIGNLDGAQLRIVLGSNRAGGVGKFDIFAATRASPADEWSAPAVVPAINSADDDFGPHQSSDGSIIYFSSNRPGGAGERDLYIATPQVVVPIIELCSPTMDDDPWVAPDGRTIVFASDRVGGSGNRDLFVATR